MIFFHPCLNCIVHQSRIYLGVCHVRGNWEDFGEFFDAIFATFVYCLSRKQILLVSEKSTAGVPRAFFCCIFTQFFLFRYP